MKKWRGTLDVIGINYRQDLNVTELLSKASERLQWKSQGLPDDSLSIENGVILHRCLRFPLIIDPVGNAIDYVMKKYQCQKVQKTSFSDKSFMKTLAGAVRFGTALLVEDVEKIDPVLNPILNKEIQRAGGRSLVRVGTEDVDYSPKFNLILSTKNPAAKLTPDLCSRVTIINFTVTPDR
jgi:dynein heavy chain 1